MASMPTEFNCLDTNITFLVSCIEASPIDLNFSSVAHHMGTTSLVESRRFTALAARVEAARDSASSTAIQSVTYTGINVPVREEYCYLLMAIELSEQRPNFSRVAEANGISKATARMKFHRLARAIHAELEEETDSDTGAIDH